MPSTLEIHRSRHIVFALNTGISEEKNNSNFPYCAYSIESGACENL